MNVILLLDRLLLAAVFSLAAVTKFADRSGSRKAMTEFGLPRSFVGPLGFLLPLLEVFVVFVLVVPASGLWGGISALALLLAFTIAISVNLVRGRTPHCHCFGQLHSAPVGWPTIVRNAALAAFAGVLIWQGRDEGGVSVLQAMSDAGIGGVVAAGLVLAFVAQVWLILHLFRQHGRMLIRIDGLEAALGETGLLVPNRGQNQPGLPIGSSAPSFEIPLLSGKMTTLERLRESGNPVLLIFSDPGCNPCNALLPDIARWEREYAHRVTVVLMSRGTVEANRAKIRNYGLKNVLLQQDREIAEIYYALGTPSAVLIDSSGSIASPVAIGAQAIADLVVHVMGPTSQDPVPFRSANGHNKTEQTLLPTQNGLHIGQDAPLFRLLDLDDNPVELKDFKGRDTLLLFWNPNCRFCSSMLPDLKEWERTRPTPAPELLVISTGAVESNRAMQLRSTVLLDQGFGVGASFGVTGTPSAILVDSDGNTASAIAVGASSVLTLASTGPRIPQKPSLIRPPMSAGQAAEHNVI